MISAQHKLNVSMKITRKLLFVFVLIAACAALVTPAFAQESKSMASAFAITVKKLILSRTNNRSVL